MNTCKSTSVASASATSADTCPEFSSSRSVAFDMHTALWQASKVVQHTAMRWLVPPGCRHPPTPCKLIGYCHTRRSSQAPTAMAGTSSCATPAACTTPNTLGSKVHATPAMSLGCLTRWQPASRLPPIATAHTSQHTHHTSTSHVTRLPDTLAAALRPPPSATAHTSSAPLSSPTARK